MRMLLKLSAGAVDYAFHRSQIAGRTEPRARFPIDLDPSSVRRIGAVSDRYVGPSRGTASSTRAISSGGNGPASAAATHSASSFRFLTPRTSVSIFSDSAMRQHGGSDADLLGYSSEAFRPGKIAHLGMVDGQEPIDRASQRSGLHRANPHNADLVRARRCHDVAG